MNMTDDQFAKLFKYIEDFRHDVDKRFEKVDQRFDQLQSAVDAYAKKADKAGVDLNKHV